MLTSEVSYQGGKVPLGMPRRGHCVRVHDPKSKVHLVPAESTPGRHPSVAICPRAASEYICASVSLPAMPDLYGKQTY